MKVAMLPIEPLKMRYSGNWFTWWDVGLRAANINVVMVHDPGAMGDQRIRSGQFLDCYQTHIYKASQTAIVAGMLERRELGAGDWVFMHDGWSPTLTSTAYMRDVGDHAFKIAAYLHAGTWDPWDHLTIKGLDRWARPIEQGWLEALDLILLGTHYHADLICKTFGEEYRSKMEVVGLPIYSGPISCHRVPWEKRPRRVLFPHRRAPEKQPHDFERVRLLYHQRYGDDGTEWVYSADVVNTMDEFYELAGRSRVSFSAALQETFGIAMQETNIAGCYPVVPDRLSYQELFDGERRYAHLPDSVEAVKAGLDADEPFPFDTGLWEGTIANVAHLLWRRA
jgi:hypothetical protein